MCDYCCHHQFVSLFGYCCRMNTTALPGCCRGILGWGLDKEGDCTIRRFLQLAWLPSMSSSCSWGRRGCAPVAVWHRELVQVCSNQFDNRCGRTSSSRRRRRRRRRKRRWKWGLVWVALTPAADSPVSRVAWAATAMHACRVSTEAKILSHTIPSHL